jgi:hypothetical protein
MGQDNPLSNSLTLPKTLISLQLFLVRATLERSPFKRLIVRRRVSHGGRTEYVEGMEER